jgi:hypothetical protein
MDTAALSEITQAALAWTPSQPILLGDLCGGSYSRA